MSRPRPVYANSVYMAKRAGARLLWSTVMSNHHHTGVHDPHGNISAFCRELHCLVAKHHNSSYGRFEYFWSSGPSGHLRLLGAGDILDKLVYSITNPVKPHLVARAKQWPGVNTTPEQLCVRSGRLRRHGALRDALQPRQLL